MNQVTVAIPMDEKTYDALTHYAEISHRDLSTVVNEILAGQLADLSLRVDAEHIRSLSMAERQALARNVWGSWTLPTGTSSIDLVRQLRADWTR